MKNEYSGYVVEQHGTDIETIKPPQGKNGEELGKWFFENYVSQRKPVVVDGFTSDLQELRKWTNSHLKKVAGDQTIDVELATEKGSFGTGNKTSMKFKDVVDRMEKGDNSMYITTQKIKLTKSGQPMITSPPITQLLDLPRDASEDNGDKIPLQPSLLGNLIPMNLNIWMGNSKQGSTTGLHHDYHDNLYVLLRGRKRFRLYSPADTANLYTQGKVERVHPNGRINYEDFPTEADGSEPESREAQLADDSKTKAEQELAAAEEAVKRGEPGAAKRLREAEEAVEEALDALLEAGDTFDDFDAVEDSDFDSEEEEEAGPEKKKTKLEEEEMQDPRAVPLNFSKVDLTKQPKELELQFPLAAKARQMVAHVASGQMLYLPAGWFHEVTSYTKEDDQDEPERSGHLAFNFWMHPPDNVEDFKSPYTSPFWPHDWDTRVLKQ